LLQESLNYGDEAPELDDDPSRQFLHLPDSNMFN